LSTLFACGGETPKTLAPPTSAHIADVALSFDELPYQLNRERKPIVSDSLQQKIITDKLVAQLTRESVPAMVFVHCDLLPPEQGLVGVWAKAGFSIGNASSSHISANTVSIEEWRSDVARCSESLKKMQLNQPNWFRFPDLESGWTKERDQALNAVIEELALRPVPASIPTIDHLYNRVYEHALSEGKKRFAETVAQEYITHLRQSIRAADTLAKSRRGMAIPHIARLHINRLNADHLEAAIVALKSDGVRFITVHEAVQDPLYTSPNAYYGRAMTSWINRVEPLPANHQGSWFGEEGWRLTERYPAVLLDVGQAP